MLGRKLVSWLEGGRKCCSHNMHLLVLRGVALVFAWTAPTKAERLL